MPMRRFFCSWWGYVSVAVFVLAYNVAIHNEKFSHFVNDQEGLSGLFIVGPLVCFAFSLVGAFLCRGSVKTRVWRPIATSFMTAALAMGSYVISVFLGFPGQRYSQAFRTLIGATGTFWWIYLLCAITGELLGVIAQWGIDFLRNGHSKETAS